MPKRKSSTPLPPRRKAPRTFSPLSQSLQSPYSTAPPPPSFQSPPSPLFQSPPSLSFQAPPSPPFPSPPSPTSSPSTPATVVSPSSESKHRLTDEEKKRNHIQSEQKRRKAIREQFNALAAMIPGYVGSGRSEGALLMKVVDYAEEQIEQRKMLIREIEARGGVVAEEDKWVD